MKRSPRTASTAARPVAAAALAALLAAALLAGCGGSSTKNTAATEASHEREAETKLADFAKCLREHGVNAKTASGPNGGHGLQVNGGSPQSMEGAQKACARYRPEAKKVDLSPQQKVELEERVQKFAKCMREHGIKLEVSTQGAGVQIGIHSHGAGGEPNPESPGFQHAQESCQKLLPKPPGAAGGGPLKSTSRAPAGGSSSGLSLAVP
jgi:hypothetical protein